jgi:hypothetical protein
VDAILAFGLRSGSHPAADDARHVVDGLRARMDDLRVQAHLGAMDGEDLVRRVRAAIHRMTT